MKKILCILFLANPLYSMELTSLSPSEIKKTNICVCNKTNCELTEEECGKQIQLQAKLMNAVRAKSLNDLDAILIEVVGPDKSWWSRYWRVSGRVNVLGLAKASRDWERIQASKLPPSPVIPEGLITINTIMTRLKRFDDYVKKIDTSDK